MPPIVPNVRDPNPRQVNSDINDPHVNPEMRFHLENAMRAAKPVGLKPVVGEAYRTPDRSDWLDRNIAGPAAPAWSSSDENNSQEILPNVF
jgi:hypothetical protein